MSKWNYSESVPDKLYVACSGGVDSVATAAILSEWRDVTLLHFSHADHAHQHELETVVELANRLGLKLLTTYQIESQASSNKEAQWRNARYDWFHRLDMPVATGHTLDDAVEWYLMTCLRGRGEFMPHKNRNVFRPFLLTDKNKLIKYCKYRNLPWWEDPGNHDPEFSLRSRVRNQMIPAAYHCEPGLKKMVKRRLTEKIKEIKNVCINSYSSLQAL
jgi:tRNA(Ile)-lysidine synthetase-like protein